MTSPAAITGMRERAGKLQALHVRLLFCCQTRTAWRADPNAVLKSFDLPEDAAPLFVDLDSDNFQTEAHGRRVGVEKNIERYLPRTQEIVKALPDGGPGFDDFLCSDNFFDPTHSLPHASGVGPGYENISKYFFWLRDAYGLGQPGTGIELRNAAYSEFSAWLINEFKRPHEPYYDRFKGGLYWHHTPGEELPMMLLSDKYVLFTLKNRDTIAQLPVIGLIDLDQLTPPEHLEPPAMI